MVDTNRTHITAILDRSGSMGDLVTETIGGFNKFLDDQKALPGDATMTLVLFDNEYEVPYNARDLKEVPPLTEAVYYARGMTALYDAIGKSIIDTGAALAKLPEEQRPGTVIVLIITDGAENSSKEFRGELGRQRVQAMVQEQTKKYSWQFIFMGANIDAKAVGASIGVAVNSSLNYKGDAQGTRAVYDVMSSGTSRRRNFDRTKGVLGSESFVDDPDAVIGATPGTPTKVQGTP